MAQEEGLPDARSSVNGSPMVKATKSGDVADVDHHVALVRAIVRKAAGTSMEAGAWNSYALILRFEICLVNKYH